MTRQLNARISDIDYLIFELLQAELKELGFGMNHRELLEFMILKTANDLKKSQQSGESINEFLKR